MAASSGSGDAGESFESFLTEQLLGLNLDSDAFGEYIMSILAEDSTKEEKFEALSGIFSDLPEDEQREVCEAIYLCYERTPSTKKHDSQPEASIAVEDRLSNLFHNVKSVTKDKALTKEEQARKQAILNQYAHVCDNDSSGDEEEAARDSKPVSEIRSSGSGATTKTPTDQSAGLKKLDIERHLLELAPNTNAQSVSDGERVKREKAKVDSQKQKEKNKQDREAQKTKKEERKEKEKQRTQKQERRTR